MTKTTFSLSIGLARLRMNAIRAVLVLLALAGGLPGLQTHSARAAVVFSTYVGGNCSCGLAGPDFLAAVPFTVGGSYDFAGAAAYMLNFDSAGSTFSMALYAASSAGGPAPSPLWTSGTLTAPGPAQTATLVSASYSGPPILLNSGTEYFFAVDMPNFVVWLGGGSPESPLYYSQSGGPWQIGGSASQYEIFGNPPTTPVPEFSTWAMMLIGFAGLSYAAARRAGAGRAVCA